MIFKCTNLECEALNKEVEVHKTISTLIGDKMIVKGSECPLCNEYMEDITPFDGWGNATKAKTDRSQAFFKRGSQKIHR